MSKSLRNKIEEMLDDPEFYGVLCDAVERAHQGLPQKHTKKDPFMHTSTEARKAATRILDEISERLDVDV